MFLFNITDIIESRMVWGKKHGGLAKIWTVKVDSLDSGWLSCGALHGRPCNMFVLFLFHKIETHFSFSIHFCTYI
jgi:hypothetical protein